MYKQEQFGKELKERVDKKQSPIEIGIWSFAVYWEHIEDIGLNFRSILLTLGKMELGPEFALTHEKLSKIAEDLITGSDVDLN